MQVCNCEKIENIECEVLKDCSPTGRVRPWRQNKIMNTYLAELYDEIDSKKAERLRNCATVLNFQVQDNGRRRLRKANFCRVRLCPMCCWRRSLKAFSQVSEIKGYLDKQRTRYSYLFLTLTVRNCWADELETVMEQMFAGFHNLTHWKPWKRAIKGYVRAFEVTRNVNIKSDWYGSYHPHVHFILAVDATHYFSKSRDLYISQEEFQRRWAEIMSLDYNPEVRVQRIKNFSPKTISEIVKYSVKFSDYLDFEDWEFSKDAVSLLDKVLHKRRFLSFGGCFSDARKALKLDDIENGDLVHVEKLDFYDDGGSLVRYFWSGGYGEYIGE